jgi:hypothetical protein
MSVQVGDVWYRVAALPFDGGRVSLYATEWSVERVSESGRTVWLRDITGLGDTRRALVGAHRQFACPTRDEALASFKARKRRQVKILNAQIEAAKRALAAAEAGALDSGGYELCEPLRFDDTQEAR